MRRVLKRGLVGVAAVTAVGGLAVAGAAPAQASTIDAHIDTASPNVNLVRVCLTLVPSPPSCLNI
jgi:hypothetical protein